MLCRRCGPTNGPKPADEFSVIRNGKRMATCKPCMLDAQAEGRRRSAEKSAGREQPAPPRPAAPAPIREPLFSAGPPLPKGGPIDAIEAYRAHLAGGNPPSNTFEAGLMADFGLNRTEVMRIREQVLKERQGITTVKCQECRAPFDLLQGHRGSRVVCPDCRSVANSVDRELATA